MKIELPRVLVGAALLLVCQVQAQEPQPAQPEVFQKAPERLVDTRHDRNLYVIGYAHLDTQWRWTYPQVTREFIANTLRDNFVRFRKYPNYIFNFSGSRRYEMMEEYYPAEFAKMKEYVAQGRWFPAGSSVDEADSMVPSAESLIRHVLYGNRYFRREFGVASDEFLLPDCFGFPYSLPTILAHAGLKGFSTQKLTWGSSVGIPFKVGVWEGPDGSSVVAALDPGGYTSLVKEDLSRNESWLARINATGAASGAYVDYHYFGTGDRGGAPAESSIQWIERSIVGQGPIRVIPSKANEMFDDLTPDQIARLPRYKGELLLTQHSAGSISSQAYMKRWNRKNELLADAAERASVAALWLGGVPYPSTKLYEAWDLVLGSQMHDMLPGTSLPKAYEYCWNDEILAGNLFSSALVQGAGGVAAFLDTRATGVPLVVFNPLSIVREDVVEAAVTFPSDAPTGVSVYGPDGKPVPAQVLHRSGHTATIAFVARMPAVAFASFDVRPVAPAAAASSELKVSTSGLENGRYRVTIAPNGDVSSIYDQQAGRELLQAPMRLAFLTERPEQFPAWNMDWSDRQKPPRTYVEGPAKIRVVESGPARVAVEIEREAEGSRFVQTLRLAAGDGGDRVEFATRIDWQTRQSSLKVVLPLTVSSPTATYDSQVGTVSRGNNDPKKYEVPQHQWFDQTAPDGSFGVAVLNDSKYGSDKPDDHTLRLTLLYTPGVRTQYQDQACQDFGRHDMLYAITSHRGTWQSAQVPWSGARLNQPMLAFQAAAHPGPLGRTLALFHVSTPQVSVEAVKKAEDGDEVVVRFQELTGSPAKAVRLHAARAIVAAREVDGQERPLGGATVSNGELVFDVRGYGLRAFALKLAAPPSAVPAPASEPVSLPYNVDVVSTNANRDDGSFDAAGRSYPAEQLPAKIVSEGVTFVTGPTADGKPNAVEARGQSIALPSGGFDQLVLLAAADGEAVGAFSVDGRTVDLTIGDWTGYVGQWDNRLWQGEVPKLGYTWFNPLSGLVPGYVKPDPVAWYASHRHTPTGDDHYQYCYLFKYRIELPPGAKTLTLPDNPKIRIFAMSAARQTHEEVAPASVVFDRIDDHQAGSPQITPDGGNFSDSTRIEIRRPLYWREGGLRYTLDGSAPTLASPAYEGPIALNRNAVITAAELDPAGHAGPVATARLTVNDKTPPSVVSVCGITTEPAARIRFSEPVQRTSAEAVANYRLSGGRRIVTARLLPDGESVALSLDAPLDTDTQLTVTGIRDASPAANALAEQVIPVQIEKPEYQNTSDTPAGKGREDSVVALPVAAGKPWTMNVWARSKDPVDNRTLIAGFGRIDDTVDGAGHYFGVFADGVHLWGHRSAHLEGTTRVDFSAWHMLTATYDGQTLRLFVDGREVSWLEAKLADDEPVVRIAPLDPWDHERRFAGEVRDLAIWARVLSADQLATLLSAGPGR